VLPQHLPARLLHDARPERLRRARRLGGLDLLQTRLLRRRGARVTLRLDFRHVALHAGRGEGRRGRMATGEWGMRDAVTVTQRALAI
jgi:hypothetical protein